ncbi:hypothetical protein Scep_028389 [Stephania cephalantha]|uniref:Uncharacterized protein n=1 Tax=Stephania cephalantha TaxID=152367 RepID=A0AAP0HLS2_9MAGN
MAYASRLLHEQPIASSSLSRSHDALSICCCVSSGINRSATRHRAVAPRVVLAPFCQKPLLAIAQAAPFSQSAPPRSRASSSRRHSPWSRHPRTLSSLCRHRPGSSWSPMHCESAARLVCVVIVHPHIAAADPTGPLSSADAYAHCHAIMIAAARLAVRLRRRLPGATAPRRLVAAPRTAACDLELCRLLLPLRRGGTWEEAILGVEDKNRWFAGVIKEEERLRKTSEISEALVIKLGVSINYSVTDPWQRRARDPGRGGGLDIQETRILHCRIMGFAISSALCPLVKESEGSRAWRRPRHLRNQNSALQNSRLSCPRATESTVILGRSGWLSVPSLGNSSLDGLPRLEDLLVRTTCTFLFASLDTHICNRVSERGQYWEIYCENFGAAFPLILL